MSKIRVTKEQANAIKFQLENKTKREIASVNISVSGYFIGSYNKTINEMNFDDLMRALYIGYEIIECAHAGDVYKTDHGIYIAGNDTVLRDGQELICKKENREDLKRD